MDWHDEDNPVRNGESVADQILNANPGTNLTAVGYHTHRAALNYVEKHRPNDSITVKFEPVPKKYFDARNESDP